MANRGMLARLGNTQEGQLHRHAPDTVADIVEHLRVLLNAREGDSLSAPLYGLGDFTELLHDFPASARKIEEAIHQTILHYEPRLEAVNVRAIASETPLELSFEVRARLVENRRKLLRLETRFDSSGRVEVD